MKSLISSSKTLLRHAKVLNWFKSQNQSKFSSLKNSSELSVKMGSMSSKLNPVNSLNLNEYNEDSTLTNEEEALKIINEYITIDDIKSRPNAIKDMILKLIKVLEYNKENTGRSFYFNNKSKIDKIIFDLKSYNSENEMSTKEILLMFYLCKLASDCGYQHKIDGFEIRGTIKLTNNLKVIENIQDNTSDTLTPTEAIYGYWLTSRIGCNNHEYKWKVYLMMLNMWTTFKKKLSENYHAEKTQTNNLSEPLIPPISLSEISSLLEAHFMEELHLSTEYHILEFLIENLHSSQSYFFTKEQYEKDENLFIKTLSHLIGIEQHFINGKHFFMLQEVVAKMSKIIESQLIEKLADDKEIKTKFLQSISLKEFLENTHKTTTLEEKNKSEFDATNKYKLKKLDDEEVFRYFFFLNEIQENHVHFKNLAYDHYSKIQFILFESLSNHFSSLIKDNEHVPIQMISLYTRTWIKKQEFNLSELQEHLEKETDPKIKAQSINSLLQKLSNEFNQLIENLATKLDQELITITGQQNKNTKKENYQTAKVKEQEKNKLIFLKNIEQNLIKPIIDFIQANGKSTIMNSTLISSEKLALIDSFEDFLTYFVGEEEHKSWKNKNDENIKVLTIENPYYWMLKYARLESVYVKDNKLFIKEFESLLEQISTNVTSKTPQSYSIISVYNIYAYLCKLQEKMMQNEENNNLQSSSEDKEIKIEPFSSKKEYQNFLTFKTYISELVFKGNLETKDKSQENKWNLIPKKYRIDPFFDSDIENFKDEKLLHLLKVSTMNKKTGVFNIERFFNIVFRANRYFNHQILSQEVLLHLFGTQELINKNLMEYISNTNQRSRENVYELIYIMLLSGNKEYDTSIPHNLELKTIKIKIQESLNDKIKGSMITETLREVLAPRKTSFLQKTPLKYRLKPYSIFETVSQESLEKKQIILKEFLDIFPSGKSHMFGWMELILYNIECLGTDRSDVVSEVVLPWISEKIKNGDTIKTTIPYYVLSILRLLRFSSLRTSPTNQKHFVEFLSVSLPGLYENLEKNKKEHYFAPLIGYLLEVEHILKRSKINSKKILEILESCKINIEETSKISADEKESKYFLKLTQILDKIIESNKNGTLEKQLNFGEKSKLFNGSDKKTSTQEKSPKRMFGNKKINNKPE